MQRRGLETVEKLTEKIHQQGGTITADEVFGISIGGGATRDQALQIATALACRPGHLMQGAAVAPSWVPGQKAKGVPFRPHYDRSWEREKTTQRGGSSWS